MEETIRKAREGSKKRKFDQSFDLIVNLKDIDIKKPGGKINEEVRLPHGPGREAKVVVFSDNAKRLEGAEMLGSADIAGFAKDRRSGKKLINRTDFFLAEPKLMPVIGKTMGQTLAPKGKMPRILAGDVEAEIESLKHSTRIRTKDAPVIQCVVGRESMDEKKLVDNISAVMKHIEAKLPQGRNNVKEVLLKLTMGKPVRLEAW